MLKKYQHRDLSAIERQTNWCSTSFYVHLMFVISIKKTLNQNHQFYPIKLQKLIIYPVENDLLK